MFKAVFVERDGLILDNRTLISIPEQMTILPGVGQALKILQNNGFRLFVISNQEGVELGLIDEDVLMEIHDLMCDTLLEEHEVLIEAVAYCPHYKEECECRLPNPTMIRDLAEVFEIDLSESYVIGRSDEVIKAGKRARCRTVFVSNDAKRSVADLTCYNLLDAARKIAMENWL